MASVFGTVITCIDGRIQVPVTAWVKMQSDAECVDMVTLPGMDGILADPHHALEQVVRKGAEISVHTHGSRVIAVAAHHDCAGNPVSVAQHEEHVRLAVERVRGWKLPAEVFGLFVEPGADGVWGVRRIL